MAPKRKQILKDSDYNLSIAQKVLSDMMSFRERKRNPKGERGSRGSTDPVDASPEAEQPRTTTLPVRLRCIRALGLNQDPANLVEFAHYRRPYRRQHFYYERKGPVVLQIWMSVIGLEFGTVLLTFNSSFAVDSLDGILARTSMYKTFELHITSPLQQRPGYYQECY